jgi:hypothetical protein
MTTMIWSEPSEQAKRAMEEIFRENSAKKGRNVYEQTPSDKSTTLMIGYWYEIRAYLIEQKIISSSFIHVRQEKDLFGYRSARVIVFPKSDPVLARAALRRFGEENVEFRT